MVREAVYSILNGIWSGFENRTMLDVFAGSGVMAVEAVSRGMKSVLCIEKSRTTCATLRSNLQELGVQDRIFCQNADARRILQYPPAVPFDFIYVDPPYAEADLRHDVLQKLSHEGWLSGDGLLLVEQDARSEPSTVTGCLEPVDSRTWGETRVSFYHVRKNSGISGVL